MLCNDRLMGTVSINADKNNNPDEGLHYIIQNAEEGWSFHVIAKSLNKLIKKQGVSNSNG